MAANIKHELKGIDLGDERRNRRIGTLAAKMAASPMESVRSACGSWNDSIAGYRLLHSENVTPEKILAAHESAAMTRAELCQRLLLVQDTTELDYSKHKALKGVGRLDAQTRQGFYAHCHLLLDEETGVPMGVCSSHIWTRDEETKDNGHKQVPFEKKESYRWFKGYVHGCEIAALQPQAEVTVVGDRESDIYEIYAENQRRVRAGEPCAHVLIRASKDRLLLVEEGSREQPERLFAAVRGGSELGTYKVQVTKKDQIRKKKGGNRTTVHREKREATLQVRAVRVTLSPPDRRTGETLEPVTLWAVGAFEVNPPDGQEPIEWILLTSQPVETFAQAQRIISAYTLRWKIEEFHRVLKSGCRVEHINMRDKDSLLSAVALYFIVAWRILYLRDFRRARPGLCSSNFFSTEEWRAACIILGKGHIKTPPTLAEIVDMVGKIGGHMGRKSDPPPGPECLWRGLAKLQCYVDMGRALGIF